MKTMVYRIALLLLCTIAVAVQAQTTVVQDTFTVTPERQADVMLPGQITEVGNRTWVGETETTKLRYFLTADGKVERYGTDGATHGDRASMVPYLINPAHEVVTVQADFLWPADVPDATYAGVAFFKNTAVPDAGNNMLWQYNAFSIRVIRTNADGAVYELLGDRTILGTSGFRWFELAKPPIPTDTEITIKLQYDSAANMLNGWVNGEHVFVDVLVSDFDTETTAEDVAWAGFHVRANELASYGITCDNFTITSTNPLLDPPSSGQVNGLGTQTADPELLDWISVDGQVYVKGVDLITGAGYDIDPDYTLFSTDPNGPRFCLVCIDDAATPPTTQLDAEILTADGKLSSGCTLDFEALPDHKASIGQFVFDMPITTHAGSDIVVISIDRDYSCGSEQNTITLLDASLNPIPGQTLTVACGQPAWVTAPGDGGTTQNYDVTGVNPSFALSLRVDSTIERLNYTAYAIDATPGLALGGIRITSPVQASPVEVFAIPETGSYLWQDQSCEAGIYALTDLNKDCITDLEDFAILAGSWLDCNTLFDASCW